MKMPYIGKERRKSELHLDVLLGALGGFILGAITAFVMVSRS